MGSDEKRRLILESQESVDSYLRERGVLPETLDRKSLLETFLQEMQRGLQGETSSLPMIPTHLSPPTEPLERNRPVLVLDAGGTNLRSAIFTLDSQGYPHFEKIKEEKMPGMEREVSKANFFDTIADHCDESSLSEGMDIAFCFSYPTQSTPQRDGRLLFFSKEIKAKEVENSLIGEELQKSLTRRKSGFKGRITLLNDSVATLLSGYARPDAFEFDDFIGVILGTGANSSYQEHSGEIVSLGTGGTGAMGSANSKMLVNLEHGSFTHFPQGVVDKEFILSTQDPTRYRFEKMTSGGYIAALVKAYLKDASEHNLFSLECVNQLQSECLSEKSALDIRAIDEFMKHPLSSKSLALFSQKESDNLRIHHLFSRLIERAAIYVAISNAAVLLKSGGGVSPLKPVGFVLDGSAFHGYRDFPYLVRREMDDLLKGEFTRYYSFLSLERAPMVGAGITALRYQKSDS